MRQVQEKPKNTIAISGGKVEAFVSIRSGFNVNLEKERIITSLKKLEIENAKLLDKLSNRNFINKAPKQIIEKFEADQKECISQLNKQRSLLESLEKINN